MNEQFQLELLRLQADLETRLRDVRDVRKAIVYGLRTTKEMFGAQKAAIATLKPGRAGADLVFSIPQKGNWDNALFTQYLAGTRPRIPANTLLAPVKRRGRNWAVLALRHEGRQFTAEHRQLLRSESDLLDNLDAVSSDYREEPGMIMPTVRIQNVKVAGAD